MSKGDRKAEYFPKVHALFRNYSKIFTICIDNVSSSQMHQIRAALRNEAVLLMGKNTLVKKAMRDLLPEMPHLEILMPLIKGNVGLVFTNGNLKSVRDSIISNKIGAPAKVGTPAQCNVSIPAGNTGMPPDKTSFFQALGIPTKIVKSLIEITQDVLLLKEGVKVGASEAELLGMLNIKPFKYGCVVLDVFENGEIYSPDMLDITDEVILKHVQTGIRNLAAFSLAARIPTVAAVPHLLATGYKNLLGLSMVSEVTFPAAEKLKEALKNAPAPSATPAARSAAPAAAAAAPAKEEKKEESDEDMGFGLFD